MSVHEDILIQSKSLALIEKTRRRVVQLDINDFPTESSEEAKKLLLGAFDLLGKEANWSTVDPAVLYNTLIRLQYLVEELEASNSEHISWPLVSFCNHIWKLLFPLKTAEIFYSVTREHNYTISSFSIRLKSLLQPVLPPTQISNLLSGKDLYCLQLASLEEENLPLYANIGHEFGHALYWSNASELSKILGEECNSVLQQIVLHLTQQDQSLARRRSERAAWIIKSIAIELFCDLIGSLIAGPSFLLSLHEMGWGSKQTGWTGTLSPLDTGIRGYPSFRFRLDCVREWTDAASFELASSKVFQRLNDPSLKNVASCLSELPTDHSLDYVSILPESDSDRSAIQTSIAAELVSLKDGLRAFLHRCRNEFLPKYATEPEFQQLSPDQVFHLLSRLEHDILPNIIPDGSLLGMPATFLSILNASALFRINMLLKRELTSIPSMIYTDIQKVERLTAKALEVAYVQREFKKWEGEKKL